MIYSPTAAFQVSGIQQDFRGANNYRPNVVGEVLTCPRASAPSTTGSIAAAVEVPTNPSQPFGNAPRNAYRGPLVWQMDLAASKRFALPWRSSNRVPRRILQPLQPRELPPPNGKASTGATRHSARSRQPRPADHSVWFEGKLLNGALTSYKLPVQDRSLCSQASSGLL